MKGVRISVSRDNNNFDEYESQFPNPDEIQQEFNLNSFASKNNRGRSDGERNSKSAVGGGRGSSGKRSSKSSRASADKRSRYDDMPDNRKNHSGKYSDTAQLSDNTDISSRSQQGRSRRRKKPKKKRGPMAKFGRVLLTIFLVCFITGCLVVGTFAVYVFGFVDDTLDDDLNELKMNFTTTVYVKNGETGEYEEYQRLHGSENRIWIGIDEIPEDLVNAYVAIEDKRFLQHNGVDWKRTVSAFANMFFNIYSSNQGGSTITQQLVKNLTGDNDQRPMRKIREIMRARYVENNYTKETIMECYLNTIALANGINGVEVASNYYFGKHASELSLAECATLAAMAKEPERYRPDVNPENNKERRLTVLSEMYDQDLISSSDYEAAKAEEVVITADRSDLNEVEINNWFVDVLIENVIDDLVEEYGYDETYASNRIYNGGFKIYSTMDPKIQTILEDVYNDSSNFARCYSSKEPDALVQSAMTVMDYEGHIVGTVGGRGEKTANRGLNRALVPRQPGSTMKPIAVYAPSLEANLITYGSRYLDKPITTKIGDSMQTWPRNASGSYSGSPTTMASALERSLNTVPVRVLQDLTLENSFDFLTKKMGITTLDETQDMVLGSLALGGCYQGITPTELTAAFATFGNLGKYYKPSTYTKITDQYDEIVLEQKNPTIAMGEDTANIMNRMLMNVVNGSSGTGTSAKFGSLPIYGKTGTTSDDNDRWFVGGTPYYVAACWFGFDTPAKIHASGNPAIPVWRAAMSKINSGLDYKDFPESEGVSYIRYCGTSGMAATRNCGTTYRGWYKNSYMPACPTHGGTALSALDKPSGVVDGGSGGSYGYDDDDDDDSSSSYSHSHTSSADDDDTSSSGLTSSTSSDDGDTSDTTSSGEGDNSSEAASDVPAESDDPDTGGDEE